MRNMSFFLTTRQFCDGSKDVTRRLGWANLKPGDHFMAVRKGQGLKPGEKLDRLGECVCISNTPERLDEIVRMPVRGLLNGRTETEREGFPDMTPEEFVAMFCKHMDVEPDRVIHRVEFCRAGEYVSVVAGTLAVGEEKP